MWSLKPFEDASQVSFKKNNTMKSKLSMERTGVVKIKWFILWFDNFSSPTAEHTAFAWH